MWGCFQKLKFCLGLAGALPLHWIWAAGREGEIAASEGPTLFFRTCTVTPFSPVHLHICNKVGTKEVTGMELCHKGILDRKIWGTRDDLCWQRNRGGPSIGKETGWDQWWVSQILWIKYFKIILNLHFNKHFNILTCTIMLIMASSCLFFSVTC